MIPPAVYVLVGYGAIFIMSVVLHEVAHGYVAYRVGDPTAKVLGRLSLNPIKHIDPFMTILLPIMCLIGGLPMFGGAKPVPVNPYHFRHRLSGERLVSTAGVLVNLLLAWTLAMVLHLLLYLEALQDAHLVILGMGIFTNLLLFAFNMVPIPPLDGSRFLRTFLPSHIREQFDRMDRYGIMIVFFLIVFLGGVFYTALRWVIGTLWVYFLRLDMNTYRRVWEGLGKALSGG